MANFKTHISWGAVLGVVFVISISIYLSFPGWENLFWIFLAVLIGSFLPDLDVDEGVPFQILFGLTATIATAGAFFYLFQNDERNLKLLVGIPVALFILIRLVAGQIFMHLTKHRGMFHSVPAAMVAAAATMWLLEMLGAERSLTIIFAIAVALGYLGHLVLDELYATINFHGLSFRPKKSLGSALKLSSRSHISTFLTYFLLATFLIVLFK